MKNIVVTGHSGFIGRNLSKRLIEKEYKVIGLDVKKGYIDGVKDIYVDIRDFKKLASCINWRKVDFIYHLAAVANLNTARKFKRECLDINVIGTHNIVEICEIYDIPLCYISTQCVYGNQLKHPVKEDVNIPNPSEIYGATKYMAEQLVKLLQKWVILRYGTVVGPDMREALATHIFLRKAISEEPIPIFGDGKQTRNWIYIDDLIDATYKVLERWETGKLNHEIINIAGSKPYSVLEMAEMCWEIVNGKKSKLKVEFKEERPGDIREEITSIEKAKKLLDWEPKIDLYSGLLRCYKSWR